MGLGSEIRFRIPDAGVKKAPDPGSGSATLLYALQYILTVLPTCTEFGYFLLKSNVDAFHSKLHTKFTNLVPFVKRFIP